MARRGDDLPAPALGHAGGPGRTADERAAGQTAAEERNYSYAGAVLEREINERLTLGAELFGNSPKERGSRSDVAFNAGGAWNLSKHVNLLFAGGRDIVGDRSAMGYIGLQFLTK